MSAGTQGSGRPNKCHTGRSLSLRARARRTQVGAAHPGARGAGRGRGTQLAAAPARLKLTGGHGGAGQTGVAGRCHRRAPRTSLWLSPGEDAASAALARPLAAAAAPSPWQSPGGAESTSLWTLPALPAPPDDALPPPLFICGFRPSGRPSALFSGCPGVGRWERRGGQGAAERTDRASSRAPLRLALPRARQGPGRPGVPEPPRQLPAPSLALLPSQPHFEQPGPGRWETDRQSDLPLLPPPQLRSRAHTKEGEETRELGSWFSCGGLDRTCLGGWRGEAAGCRAGGPWTQERDP